MSTNEQTNKGGDKPPCSFTLPLEGVFSYAWHGNRIVPSGRSSYAETTDSSPFVIFLDMDGTLKSDHEDFGEIHCRNEEGKLYQFDRRPYAIEFVKAMKQLAPTYIYTASSRRFANRALKALGLIGLVDGVYSRENMQGGGFPSCSGFVLVDDIPDLARLKAERLNLFRRSILEEGKDFWIVSVNPYMGGDEEGRGLEDAEDEVKRIMKQNRLLKNF